MRFSELRHGGDRPFVLSLHPRLTLLAGLGDDGRQWMAELLQRVVRGELESITGTVEVHGVERQLTDALIAELDLPADADVVVRAADLPGARTIVPPASETERSEHDPLDDSGLPDLRTLANELAQARHALARATENRVHAEQLLDGSRVALAPEAADVATAEARLAEARQRRESAAVALEAVVQAAPADDRRQAAAARAQLQERKAELEVRRQSIMEAIDGVISADPSRVAAALSTRRAWTPTDPQPVPEALALADDLDAVDAQLRSLPEVLSASPALLADAEAELATARADVVNAEALLAQRQVSPDDAARIDAVHAEVVDAEDKADRRLASPLAKKRLKDAVDAELVILRALGFSSYSDYLLSTSTLITDPAAPKRLGDARRRLADAEAVWEELTGTATRRQREEVEDRQVELLKRARDLLGHLPDTDVPGALRALRTDVDGPDDAPLIEALHASGIDGGGDPVAAAERFLAAADEGHARRAALQAELSTIADDLDELQREFGALPPAVDGDSGDTDLDAARDALQRAQEDEQQAHRAAVDARSAAAEHRAAIQRIQGLEADLEGAHAAEQQAAARVAQIEATTADAEHQHEQRRSARQAAAERLDATLDLTEVERIDTEVYLLARIAAQRDVGQAGSLPLVVADAINGLPVETTQGVLDVIERFAPVVQFVLMSDDPEIEEWARSFGPEGAAVRRFSFVPSSA